AYVEAMTAIERLVAGDAHDDGLLDAGLAVRLHIGPDRISDSVADSLSLCMIVRNEAKFLAACLHAAKPLADEIIVVDTGSNDRTADIARLYGAQVHAFSWCDDFAAARNAALGLSGAAWVLVLDADELIAAQDFEALRSLIRSQGQGVVAYTLQTRNYCNVANAIGWQANMGDYQACETGMGWFPSNKVRLFKRHPAVRFHFPVHERVEPSLRSAGIPIKNCPVPVHHYGHLDESRNLEKAKSYFSLGYAKLEEMKDDPAAVRELAVAAGQLERWDEAVGLWQRLLTLRPNFLEALVNLAAAYWQQGDYLKSLAWSRRAVAMDSNAREAHYNLGISRLMQGEFEAAVEVFQPLAHRHPTYFPAIFMLAAGHACCGRTDQARNLSQSLVRHMPREALAMALDDLALRLFRAGLQAPAANLERMLPVH
ncbi:MAG: glycosyltransferase, partial [Desulfatitalea sp.]|nr:glycosyltransferase [Desulfatitalea sp.]NNK01867.1 glycosyltransferase [Desulfatitalea sp.]